MLLRSVITAVLISCALAQYYQYANLFAVNWPIVAYVVNSTYNQATTYLVACTAGSVYGRGNCDFVQPFTLVQGPSTFSEAYTGMGGFGSVTLTMGCTLQSTTSMGCDMNYVANNPSPTTALATSTTTLNLTGSQLATIFRNIALVTNSSSLLTYSPTSTPWPPPTSTGTASPSATSANAAMHSPGLDIIPFACGLVAAIVIASL